MSAAFTLFGLSWLYGIAGSTNLNEIAQAVAARALNVSTSASGVALHSLDPLLAGALVLTIIGFGFKVAAAPFHLWAPDAYQGAPVPSAAFIASGSKVAGFFVFAKVILLGFAGAEGNAGWHQFDSGWMPVLAIVACASMVLGNLAALAQTSVRRLLAYSAIAHSGYMLLGILSGKQGTASLLYYVITYGLTALGAFGVVAIVQERAGGENLSDFAGLSRRAPALSLCMLVFMLSLAGIPPLAGFFGKFYLFASALGPSSGNLNLLWLVALALGASAVSLYYYLMVLKQIYVREPAAPGALQIPVLSQVVIAFVAAAVLILGCVPGLLLNPLARALLAAGP
jgi:NADH-quinone oxidoreductase subunit N